MSFHQLNIQIDAQGLELLNQAGQRVTIVQQVGVGSPVVAWVSFQPRLGTNTVTWFDNYSVYASTTQIQHGAQIIIQQTRVAPEGFIFTLRGGQLDFGQRGLPDTAFGVTNDDPSFTVGGNPMVTSGLYQEAIVNGQATAGPINAVGIAYQASATFTPMQRVQVFAAFAFNSQVISFVTSPTLLVDMTQGSTQTIRWDNARNQFVMVSLLATDGADEI